MTKLMTALLLASTVLAVGCHHKKKETTPEQVAVPVSTAPVEPAPSEPAEPAEPAGPVLGPTP